MRTSSSGTAVRSRFAVVAIVFVVALVWRGAWLVRLQASPFAERLDGDARIYWAWSGHILRHGIDLPAACFLAPLYPYALAAGRALFGGMTAVLAIQVALGAISVALLTDASRRIAGARAALLIGLALATLDVWTWFDGLLLPESMLLFLESLLLWHVTRRDWARADVRAFVLYGLLAGAIAVGRGSHAVLLLLVLPLARAAPPGHRLRHAATAALAFFACCLPVTLANWRASGEMIPLTYNVGYNLYVGNHDGANGRYADITAGSTPTALDHTSPVTGGGLDGRAYLFLTTGRRLGPAASSGAWARAAAGWVRTHPLQALALAGEKLRATFNQRELPQIESLSSYATVVRWPGLPVVGTFALLVVLGLAGLPLAREGTSAGRWLAGYVLVMAAAILPFFVTDRYRVHLVPALAVFSAVTLERCLRLRAMSARDRGRTLVPLALAIVVVVAPAGPRATLARWAGAADRAMRRSESGDAAGALSEFTAAERALPGAPAARSLDERIALGAFERAWGDALAAVRRDAEALAHWRYAAALSPNDALALERLMVADEAAGRSDELVLDRRRLRAVPGGEGLLDLSDGWSAAGAGNLAAAESLFTAATLASPDLALAWEGLIRARIQLHQAPEAELALDQARSAGLDPWRADVYDAYLLTVRGERESARRALDRVGSRTFASDPVLANLRAWAERPR